MVMMVMLVLRVYDLIGMRVVLVRQRQHRRELMWLGNLGARFKEGTRAAGHA